MTEHPILFSGPMVRAILAGTKTQTRWIVPTDTRSQSEDTFMRGFPPNAQNVRFAGMYAKCDAPSGSRSVSYRVKCPYGWLGDRLWVKETFSAHGALGADGRISYRADVADGREPHGLHWKPSIFMPRKASRIAVEIVMIRVQRLQDITEADAKAEGVRGWYETNNPEPVSWMLGPDDKVKPFHDGRTGWSPSATATDAYRRLWNSINGSGSWNTNPWIWVIEFRKVTP